jgi:ABC-2 type transport system ATP-binding protein
MMQKGIQCFGLTKKFDRLEPDSTGRSSATGMWVNYIAGLVRPSRRSDNYRPQKGNLTAVDHLDLTIPKGEFFALLGSNGAGKTTLIKMLATVLSPTEGTAFVNGYDLTKDTQKVRRSVAVVSTGGWLGFDLQLSVEWNLRYWAEVSGLDPATARRRTGEILDLVGLTSKAGESSSILSGGMRQRLAIGKGLLVEAPILMMDEPTVGLDPHAANAIRAFVKHSVNDGRGVTVALTTQNMEEADQLCDRIAILDHGRIVAIGSPWALKRDLADTVIYVEGTGLTPALMQRFRDCFHVRSAAFGLNAGSGRHWHRLHATGQRFEQEPMTNFLGAAGASDLLLKHVPPNLEDVYMSLVGREAQGAGSCE